MIDNVKNNLFEARTFKPEDAALLASWMSTSPEDLFMLSSSLIFPLKPKTLIEIAQNANPDEHKFYSVYLVNTNTYVGHFEIKNINTRHKIGTGAHIILSQKYRGKGMGRYIVDLLNEVGFTVLDLDRLSLNVHTSNRAAIACYVLVAGYTYEGLIREVLLFNGKRYSLYQMGLLRFEYEQEESSNSVRRGLTEANNDGNQI